MGNDQIKPGSISDKDIPQNQRQGDERTEMREEVNERVDEQNHDLEKELELPQTRHLNEPCEDKYENVQKDVCELPILTNPKNPEIRQEVLEQDEVNQQQKEEQIIKITSSAVQQPNDPISIPEPTAQAIIKKCIQPQQPKQIEPPVSQIIRIHQFSCTSKSPTIILNESCTIATQTSFYWQNNKLILSEPVSAPSKAFFKVENLKYCVGMGMAIREIMQKHEYNYKSYENELSHGLFLVTSQGYSWSHAYKSEDDAFRPDFKKMKNGDTIKVAYDHDSITFTFKEASFSLLVPDSVRQKYTLCFCAYLHEKSDSIGLINLDTSEHNENIL